MDEDILKINNAFVSKNSKEIYSSLLSYLDRNKENIRFQIHPLGFKYFKLGRISKTEEFRLHFWIESHQNQDNDLQIHDHSFNFESFVVYGSLRNIKYISKNIENSKGFIYDVHFKDENSKLVLNCKNQLLDIINLEVIETGAFYNIISNEFHKSENIRKMTVSLLKIIKPENKVARVFSPKEINNYANFKRTFISKSENLKLIKKLICKVNKGQKKTTNKDISH